LARAQLGLLNLIRQDYGSVGEALLTALDLALDDLGARLHLTVLHVMAVAPDEAWAPQLSLVTEGSDHADEARRLLASFASNGPVTPARDHADSHPKEDR
jgi:hypothetical protein